MKTENLSTTLQHMAEQANTREEWIAPLLKAVDETPYEVAIWQPGDGVASVWEITLHAAGWMQDLLHDLAELPGIENVDWPQISDACPGSWASTQIRVRGLVSELESLIGKLSEDQLTSPPRDADISRARRISNILIHNAYHAGQIVKLRQLYRSENPRRSENGREAVTA